ncbi:MAG: FAD-dependent oxidoreductase [Candidatus Omnitrophota bacterium]|nr:FAD-dependent oxidoreductase [Candidatus Omnitrophota bacterium]
MEKIHDLIIIGAGPAGITAAVYASRNKLDTLLVTEDIGGQAAWSGDIENYTGYQFITGVELAGKFEEHMKKYATEVKENEPVSKMWKEGEKVCIETLKNIYFAKTAIIASGKKSKELEVPGEREFKNKGLTYCAICDGPLFEGKDVAVIGGGNSALDAGLQLIKIAKKVYMLNITAELGGDAIMREKLMKADNFFIINSAEVTEIFGEKLVKGLKYKKQSSQNELLVQGVFVEIGLIPNSEFIKDVDKNKYGEIVVNCRTETSVPGIFAAGDVTDVPEKQIIIAAGEGAKAALEVFRFLSKKRT